MKASHKQLQYIQDFLIEIADGNFESKLSLADETDEQLVAMKVGIDMLIEELKETTISRVFLNSIYNGINEILIVLDENGVIQNINEIGKKLLLFSDSELMQQGIEKLILIDDFSLVKQLIKNSFNNEKIQEVGLNFISKNDTSISTSCSFSPLYNKQNEPSGVLLVAKDISALLNAKNQLQDKNDELNLFVYKASHDLKGPISSIHGIINLINKSEDLEEIKMYCRLVDESSKKLDVVINDLLVLGRVTYGELKYKKVDIKYCIDSILKSLEFAEGRNEIKISLKVDKDAQWIKTEQGLFNTILLNLIDNAIKYRSKKKGISIINLNVSKKGDEVIISVKDNGIGIEKTLQENIFKIFYRATYESKGSGLGLYIVKMSVLKLGGTLTFKSILDKGTTFTIKLPIRQIRQGF